MSRGVATALCGLLLALGTARAATFTWTGAVSNDWFDPLNWDLAAVPTAGAGVNIGAGASVLLTNSTPALGSVTMSGGTLTFTNWTTRLVATNISMTAGTLTHAANKVTTTNSEGLWIPVARVYVECDSFTLGAAATINVTAMGYQGRTNHSGKGYGPGGGSGSTVPQGGSHGGSSQRYTSFAMPEFYGWVGVLYGSLTEPSDPGSGGGTWDRYPSGAGGGVVRIEAPNGPVTIDGTISANGQTVASSGRMAAGSGGSIWITARTLAGSGAVSAKGGADDSRPDATAGGGGRIAVHYDTGAQALEPVPGIVFSAAAATDGIRDAEDGTLYFSDSRFLQIPVIRHGGAWFSPDLASVALDSLVISNLSFTLRMPGVDVDVAHDVRIDGAGGRLMCSNNAVRVGGSLDVDRGQVVMIFAPGTNPTLQVDGDALLTNSAAWRLLAAVTNDPASERGGYVAVGGTLTLATNCWVYPQSQSFNGGSLRFRTGNLNIASNAGFNANLRGFRGAIADSSAGYGPGRGLSPGSGGGYGGKGGNRNAVLGGGPYGLPWAPVYPGSGGGRWDRAVYPAGGLIWIDVDDRARVFGTLTARGGNSDPGSGSGGGSSGGGIFLSCLHLETGDTTALSVRGGNANITTYSLPGDGGGGRIAVWLGVVSETEREQLLAGAGSGTFSALRWVTHPLEEADPDFWGPFQPYQGTYDISGGTMYTNAVDGTLYFLRFAHVGTVIQLR